MEKIENLTLEEKVGQMFRISKKYRKSYHKI